MSIEWRENGFQRPEADRMLEEALEGLCETPKTLPCKYFYDEVGSALFDRICELEEYYPTRTESGIMRDNIDEIARALGPNVLLVEYGSGSCVKTRLLLDNLEVPAAYIPIDISGEHLLRSAGTLEEDYPAVEILPVVADYSWPLELPSARRAARRRVVYFPGSTIGNFHPPDAARFLAGIRRLVGDRGGLLIGVDLRKDSVVIERAYNDSEGVTAAFNLNILARLNRECGADFDLGAFRHRAVYNQALGRVEMHLFSGARQIVRLGPVAIPFAEGESILTECSYKYSPEQFAEVARLAGFEQERVWTDPRRWFSVQYLKAV